MELGNVVRNIHNFTDDDIIEIVKRTKNPNELLFTHTDDIESQNIFNMCAFHRPGLLPKLKLLGCKPHIATRFSKNPMVEALFDENIPLIEYLFNNGYFLFYDGENCLFKVDDERFEDPRFGDIDIIDALHSHGKHRSIQFIKDVTDCDILKARDKNKRLYYVTK